MNSIIKSVMSLLTLVSVESSDFVKGIFEPSSGVPTKEVSSTLNPPRDFNKKSVKILSLDGGGVKGIISARILQEFEKCTGKPIAKIFDVMGGTSTGALQTLFLSTPGENGNSKYTAKELTAIYRKHMKDVFQNTFWQRLKSGWGYFSPKHSSKGIGKMANEYLKKAELKEAISPIILLSIDLNNARPHFFQSERAKEDPSQNYLSKDLATAVTAAPIFFSPQILKNSLGEEKIIMDAGIVVNNPTIQVISEAHKLYPKMDNLLIVSIGTGKNKFNFHPRKMLNAGAITWMEDFKLFKFMIVAEVQDPDVVLNDIYDENRKNKNYYRLEPELTENTSEIDNASDKNMGELYEITEKYIHDNAAEIAEICEKLKKD